MDEFRESARLLIFEMFCRIHQCISLEMLASRLNMQKVSGNWCFKIVHFFQTEAERWIVNLIRNYRIEGAKIDSQSGQVVMSGENFIIRLENCILFPAKPVSIHEQVMENTKRMALRSQQVALQLEKLRIDKKVLLELIIITHKMVHKIPGPMEARGA